jgi:hypothetical protein
MDLSVRALRLTILIHKDPVCHLSQYIKHTRMAVRKGEVSRAVPVRKPDTAPGVPQFVLLPVEFIDIDHVETEVAHKYLISLLMKSSEVRVRAFLPVSGIIACTAILPKVAHRMDPAVLLQIIESDTTAAIISAKKESAKRIGRDMAGAKASAWCRVQNRQC